MNPQLVGALFPAAVVLAVIVYSVWRARRESTALVDGAIARSNAQVAAALARWDAPRPSAPAGEPAMAPVREAFGRLVRDDDLALLRQTLGGGQPVEDAGRALGLTPEQARERFADALRRLCAFAEVAEAQGFAG